MPCGLGLLAHELDRGEVPMQPPDVTMPVNENVRFTLGEYGGKLTGPSVTCTMRVFSGCSSTRASLVGMRAPSGCFQPSA